MSQKSSTAAYCFNGEGAKFSSEDFNFELDSQDRATPTPEYCLAGLRMCVIPDTISPITTPLSQGRISWATRVYCAGGHLAVPVCG
jgi:hypothetical protein